MFSFTPDEIAAIQANPRYEEVAGTAWSSWTYAGLLAYLDAIQRSGVEQVPWVKYLMNLVEMKRIENSEQGQLNEEDMAAIANAGGSPTESSYLQANVRVVGTIAGGAGQFPAATAIPAVASKQIFLEEIELILSSNTASSGVVITLNDGAGGTLTYDCAVTVNNPTVTFRPCKVFTTATLVEWVGTPGAYTICDNSDYVLGHFKYRLI